jgi:hypothetical protein
MYAQKASDCSQNGPLRGLQCCFIRWKRYSYVNYLLACTFPTYYVTGILSIALGMNQFCILIIFGFFSNARNLKHFYSILLITAELVVAKHNASPYWIVHQPKYEEKNRFKIFFVSDRCEENNNELGFSVDKKKIFLSYLMHAKRITCLQMEIARRSFSDQPRQK